MARKVKASFMQVAYGDEPTFTDFETLTTEEQKSAIGNALSWYNKANSTKDSKTIFLDYVTKNHKKQLPAVKAVTSSIISTYGNIVKLLENGCVSSDLQDKLDAHIEELAAKGSKIVSKQKAKVEKKPKGKVLSIQERISEQTHGYIGTIEGEVDEFLLNDCKKSAFNLYTWYQINEVKGVHARRIKTFYKVMYDELCEVVAGKDAQLNEGYAYLSKAKQRKFAQFVAKLISDTDEWITNCNSKRKIRKRKVKTPAQIVSKLKYKTRDDDYNIESVDPTALIDATQVWVFDTKTRFLHKYTSGIGIVVEGTTLKEFDKSQSFRKKIREAYCKDVLNDVVNGGKVKLRKVLDSINAKEVPVTGRLNKEMVIVRVVQ